MDSPTTPKPLPGQAEGPGSKSWHPRAKSAGLGWMELTSHTHLHMYFDIGEFVLEDMQATIAEVDHLVLRRLIPRPLSYPRMERLKHPPPDGFKRISLRYLMLDNPDPLNISEEDIVTAFRMIRIHLKSFQNVEGPFCKYNVVDRENYLRRVVLRVDFHPTHGQSPEASSQETPNPEAPQYEPSIFSESRSTLTSDGLGESFLLSDCSSFDALSELLYG